MSAIASARLLLRKGAATSSPALRKNAFAIASRMMSTQGAPTDEVIIETVGQANVITLNRPKALNSLNLNMVRTLTPQYKKWASEKSAKMIIMKGAGEKAFCAGGDIKAIYDAVKSGVNTEIRDAFFKEEYELNNLISVITKDIPHIALIDGITMGGGVGLSVHGSFRVATEKTVFAMPETAIGFFTDVGGSYFLPRLQGNLGMLLGLTGSQLKGKSVYAAGVATHFVNSADVPQLQKRLIELNTNDHEKIAEVINEFAPKDLTQKDDTVDKYIELANSCFGEASVEEIVRKVEQQAASGNELAKQTLEKLKQVSPTSLKVVHKLLQLGKQKKDLKECLDMEYKLSQSLLTKSNDFYEGVRALLVDKDKNPKWQPARLEEVKVDQYFQ
eukprot:GEZU01012084.1.p1 GENE.GEZU01012084.1~~GEZU01012084.1.p1  ORF type:complete len:388 (-),score=190.11 GEZU01012084.1:80-1243(-)